MLEAFQSSFLASRSELEAQVPGAERHAAKDVDLESFDIDLDVFGLSEVSRQEIDGGDWDLERLSPTDALVVRRLFDPLDARVDECAETRHAADIQDGRARFVA